MTTKRFAPASTALSVVVLTTGSLLSPPRVDAAPVVSATTQPAAAARFVPERKDDLAWENDRIAFRVYGPTLERDEPPPLSGSGIDVWVKSVRRPVMAEWYKGGDYHVDHGEGLDFFNVGASRGSGGLGVWADGKLHISGNWKTHEIKQADGDKAVLSLTYAPWDAGRRKVWEKRTITLPAGSSLNRVESTIESDQPGELIVGIGVTRNPVKGSGKEPAVFKDKDHGVLSAWSAEDPKNGSMGYGVVVDPAAVIGFERDALNDLILIKVTAGKPFVYYTGACWSKGPDFKSREAWEQYLVLFKRAE